MKRLSLYLFLVLFTLPTLSQADDIRDFQIEGMSVGDSLLDFYSLDEITNANKTIYPTSDKIYQIELKARKENNYDTLSFSLKKNDNLYKIFSVGGAKFFKNDLKSCMDLKKKVIKATALDFSNLKEKTYEYKYLIDDKKSIAYITDFIFSDESSIRAFCVNWSKITEKKRGFADNFALDISSREYLDWLNNEAY